MCGTASAASAVLTVMRTSSDPALARDFTCCTVPSMSAVSVFVIDCTTMGPAPPTRTGPMDTWTELRRWMDGMVCSEKGFLGPDILHGRMRAPHNRSVRRESGHRRNAEGASSARKRSGTRTADRGGSGEWWTPWRPPTEGERRHRRPISQVTGQRAAGASYARAVHYGFRSACDTTYPAVRPAPEAGRQDGGLWRLGHAAAVRLADRRAPCRAPRRRRLRCFPHVRDRPRGRARQAIPPEASRQ